jgi:hypothetical protein
MTFLINIFFWLLSGLLKYQSSTEQSAPFTSVPLSSVVVLTIGSRMVLHIMASRNVSVKIAVNRL